jgi:hypothetical protein
VNVRFTRDIITITPGLKIRPVRGDELLRWHNSNDVHRFARPEELAEVRHVIEQSSSSDKLLLPLVQESAEDLYTLLALIQLNMPERICIPFAELSKTEGSLIDYEIWEIGSAMRPREARYRVNMNIDDSDLSLYWNRVTSPTVKSRRLRRAIGRWSFALERPFAEETILQTVIGLECLFSPDGDPPKNGTNVTCGGFIEWTTDPTNPPPPEVLLDRFLATKELYRLRSSIVHGREVEPTNLSSAADQLIAGLKLAIGVALEQGIDLLEPETLFDHFLLRTAPVAANRNLNLSSRKRERKINGLP